MLDLDTLDLKRLRAFLLVAKNGSLRHAASALNLSIPAVSIQIHKLEQELGVALFERAGRRLTLTLSNAAPQRYARATTAGRRPTRAAARTGRPVPRGP